MTTTTLETDKNTNTAPEIKRFKPIPGPEGLDLMSIGSLIQNHNLEAFQFLQLTYGNIVECKWPNRHTIVCYRPEYAKYILRDNHTNYVKSKEYKYLKNLLGEGLLTSEGELWRKQRKILAKSFHPKRMKTYFSTMKEITQQFIDQKYEATTDISDVMMKLTYEIASQVFFGMSSKESAEKVKNGLYLETERATKKFRSMITCPDLFPTTKNIEANKGVKDINNVVNQIISSDSANEDNVLGQLKAQNLPAKQIRDEVMTLLLAGHETTSNALTWTFYHLCKNPEYIEKIFEEVNSLEIHEIDDLEKLRWTKAVFLESMRLHPPIPMVSRQALKDDEINRYKIPKGASIMIVPYVMNRDPALWNYPLEFSPTRFLDYNPSPNDYKFIPFAKGPRSCIGENMAMIEGLLILAMFIKQYKFEIEEGFTPIMEHNITLRSANGMRIKLTSRS